MDDSSRSENDQENIYWKKRMKEAKWWNIFFNLSNAAFSVVAILEPMTDNHRLLNIIYFAFSIVQFALCATDNEQCIYVAHIFLTVRVYFRMLDFEDTREFYDPVGNWYFLCASKLTGCYANIIMMIINFKTTGVRWFILLLIVSTCVYSIMVGIYDFEYVSNLKVASFVAQYLSVYALGVF